jgi:hypothetical protein
VFTLPSSTLIFLCALNLDNKPLYPTTFMSFFVYGYGHFIIENLVYTPPPQRTSARVRRRCWLECALLMAF